MIFLSYLHFFCFVSGILLGIYVIYKNHKSSLNITFSVLMLCYAFWNLGDIVLHNPDKSIKAETVKIMQNIASIGWAGFSSVLLCFSIVFAKKDNLFKNKWLLALVILLPALFISQQFNNKLTVNPTPQYYGWSVEWTDTIWSYMFFAYFVIFTILALLIIINHGSKTKIKNEKKQARIISVSIFFGLVMGIFLDVVFQITGFVNIPPISNLLVFIFILASLYAIIKFKFLTISPIIAADKIISVMDEILLLTDNKGNIININKAASATLNYSQSELKNKPLTILFAQNNKNENIIISDLKNVTISNQESIIITKDSRSIPVIFSISSVKDAEGDIIGAVFIARDITKLKQIEEQLIKAKEKAEENDRLKSSFLANISHEIRTPMNSILGFTEILKNPDLKPDLRLHYLNTVEKNGERMLSLLNDLIDISKIEAKLVKVVYSEVNINEQMNYIQSLFIPESKAKKLQLIIKPTLPDNRAIIYTDKEKFYAILANLVKNAIKYTLQGIIEFGYILLDNQGMNELEFYVKDTGIGIPKDKQEVIFERFVQADIKDRMAFEGAGLGLSIAKAYVEMLGGKIWLESEEGIGSVFYFTLPFNVNIDTKMYNNSVEQNNSNLKNYIMPKNLKVLIVEDDKSSEMLLITYIKEISREILRANNGIDALEIYNKNPDIDLILMDLKLPKMNGYETTCKIREINKNVIIIAQTAYGMLGDRDKALEAGCNDYITKPIYKDKLFKIINTQLARKM